MILDNYVVSFYLYIYIYIYIYICIIIYINMLDDKTIAKRYSAKNYFNFSRRFTGID